MAIRIEGWATLDEYFDSETDEATRLEVGRFLMDLLDDDLDTAPLQSFMGALVAFVPTTDICISFGLMDNGPPPLLRVLYIDPLDR